MNRPTTYLRASLALLLILGFASPSVWATGTASGTTISNMATLSYFSDGASAEVLSSPTGNTTEAGTSTTFSVSSKINAMVAMVGGSATNVSSGQMGAVTTFSVTNTGNTTQDYALSVSNLASGTTLLGGTDDFDAADCKVLVETNGILGYQPEADTATFIDELQQDTSKAVYVICNIPVAQAGDEAIISLTAIAHTGLTIGVLGGNVAGNNEVTDDGKYSARNAYLLTPKN